ncbi:MAG: sugar-binding transcriptional regulator [Desulfobacterales bacterium]|nr:MAG: sugar-binding transcriptional regulator [Desulfobacterales bacterium]
MLQYPDEDRSFLEFLARMASLYYLEGKTQVEVARALGISRQKVQRLLSQARELGIVEINIKTSTAVSLDFEKKLKSRFNLSDALVAASYPDEEERRRSVTRAAAGYLERHLSDGMVVTVGMGRNTGGIPDFYHPSSRINCTFVSAMGSSPHVGESINPNDICQKLAANSGGRAIHLHAPAYVESKRVRDILYAQEAVGPILTKARKADIAIVGIGTPSDDATLVRMDCISLPEAKKLAHSGAVGDMLGTYFDLEGRLINPETHGHLVGLTLDDLRHIRTVIAVVSEKGKSKAILGALHTGVIHVLITDSDNAMEVMRMIN